MDKDNFLNNIRHLTQADKEALRAELKQAAMSTSGKAGEQSGDAVSDDNAQGNSITPEEFEQGVFLKIMLKSLPEVVPPPDFTEQVMNRVDPQPVPTSKVWRKVAAAVIISALITGGALVAIHSGENTEAPLRQENTPVNNTVVLPEIKPVTSEQPSAAEKEPAMKKNVAKSIKKQNSIESKVPQKGDSTIVPTDGPTPED